MKKMWLMGLTLLLSNTSFAENLENKVHSVLMGEKNQPHIVRLLDGRVIYLEANETEKALALSQTATPVSADKLMLQEPPLATDNFEPTILPNLEAATAMFERLNSKYQRVSQCFNRAHVWSSEEFKTNGIKTLKTFVFFPQNYLTAYRFNWWFHVAPTVLVQEGDQVVHRVLDYRYAMKPLTIKEWTDLFVYSKRSCPEIPKLSMYHTNPQTEHCYIMNSSMYYYQPTDFDKLEATSVLKTQFNKFDVSGAYSEAF